MIHVYLLQDTVASLLVCPRGTTASPALLHHLLSWGSPPLLVHHFENIVFLFPSEKHTCALTCYSPLPGLLQSSKSHRRSTKHWFLQPSTPGEALHGSTDQVLPESLAWRFTCHRKEIKITKQSISDIHQVLYFARPLFCSDSCRYLP
jgi:hypothetical protein